MKTEYIPFDEFVPYGECLSAGEQTRVNHTNCTAGEDTKRRLYIKRTEDDRNILAYCHNCGLHGCYRDNYTPLHSLKERAGQGKDGGGINNRAHDARGRGEAEDYGTNIPRDFQSNVSDWGNDGRLWFTRYGFTPLDAKEYKIGYSERLQSVVFPIYREGKLLGIQRKTFKEGAPKYITKTKVKPVWWYSNDYGTLQSSAATGICIVEDILSGIKCAKFMPTVALLGANVGDELAAFLVKENESKKFTIFLDDDNRQIKLNQLKIKEKLEQMGYEVNLITGVAKDPKECSEDFLRQLLCGK